MSVSGVDIEKNVELWKTVSSTAEAAPAADLIRRTISNLLSKPNTFVPIPHVSRQLQGEPNRTHEQGSFTYYKITRPPKAKVCSMIVIVWPQSTKKKLITTQKKKKECENNRQRLKD